MFRVNIFISILQTLLILFASVFGYTSNERIKLERTAMGLTSSTDFVFDAVSAEDIKVTENEKKRCRDWYNANILTDKAPAYDFTVGLRKLSSNMSDWSVSIGEESEEGAVRRGGKTTYITLDHKNSGLCARVEATIYEKFATCEWTVFITNKAANNSPVVKGFYAADITLETGPSDVYFSKGSTSAADDFELMRSHVSPTPMIFNAKGGRSSSWLPYLNISGNDYGIIAATGWTGQWRTCVKQTLKGVDFNTKQEYFCGYLAPGETVRSPLVSFTFYDGSNALKGFNTFRSWESSCVYTESAFPLTTVGLANEFDRRGEADYISQINSIPDYICEQADFLWRDAGWYPIKGDWYDSVGTWKSDPERFPNGFAPIAEAAENRGLKLLLWFEPERCCVGTEVYEECKSHEGWLIEVGSDTRNMVNLANDGACEYIGELVANAIKENHVGLYRQDFNFDPLELWLKADKTLYGGRTGFEENHYVTNLYKYLDTLLEVNPGLIIDNCASGGRRLDLEMTRRSIPLWRSDYNCMSSEGTLPADVIEATQSATYGLSFWLPLHGTGIGGEGEYRMRSSIVPCSQTALGFKELQSYMSMRYYPLIYGARDLSRNLAMQFGDENEGTALIYKRENVSSDVCHITFNGLLTEKNYGVYVYDDPNNVTVKTGAQLMTDGFDVSVPESPEAVIIIYRSF